MLKGFQKGHKGFRTKESYKRAGIKISEIRRKTFKERGYLNSEETKRRIGEAFKGKKLTIEHKNKIAEGSKRFWDNKGRKGKTRFLHTAGHREYVNWRKQVFERNDYRCLDCGIKSGEGVKVYLEAHHIYSWANYLRLRYVLENGQTLCKPCHTKRTKFEKTGKITINFIPDLVPCL